MEKLAHSFGLRRSTRSFAKLTSGQHSSPQPDGAPFRHKEPRQSMGPPLAPGKSHLPMQTESEVCGSKRAMLSQTSISTSSSSSSTKMQDKSLSQSQSVSSSKKGNGSWDRRLSVGIKRTISKLKLNSKSAKSSYLPVGDENEAPSPSASSVSSVGSRSKSSYETHMIYRNGIGASLDQLSARFGDAVVEPRPQQCARERKPVGSTSSSTGNSSIGAPSASPYIARAPRMGTSALRYSRDLTASNNSRPSRLDQSFNAMLPVAEELQDIGDNERGNDNGGFLWKAGWNSRYNL